jgi:D-glycero-D-manno-heptose 1,7-bisphosphate phosphatase
MVQCKSLELKRKMIKKIAFLDRDGVINQKAAEHQYISRVEEFVFNPGIFKVLKQLQSDGYEFIVISNQRGVARGIFSEKDLQEIHNFMLSGMELVGVYLLDAFYCIHEKDTCKCRKPKPGLLLQATAKYDINLSGSVFISDSAEDIRMGKEFGISKNILIPHDRPECYESKN